MAEELLWLPVTALAYVGALRLRDRVHSPLTNPTLVALLVLGVVVVAAGVDYDDYHDGTEALTWLLGPAVVALAVPVHRERALILRHARAIGGGVVAGAVAAAALGWLASRVMSLPEAWSLAATSRSATSPMSIAIAEELPGGSPALSAATSIIAGIAGGTFGPSLLDALGVRHPVARGLAHGVAAHGVGTARMLEEGEAQGAASTVGMGLGGLAVALVLPSLWGG
ncbi:LrgB family protein [Conexibacter sp. SYSU D00693]|uniref:LrgB family protein n=1 Tax=Conexibacter sp. SYSU D00693 TaxID=2812560 RepID=UPI00196AEFCA|nr:LrgB family protein [Conexibacter sp. SYSU D00693]